MIMRFRPANIRLINRRHYLPRLRLTLFSKGQMQKPPQRFEDVDRVTPYQERSADNPAIIDEKGVSRYSSVRTELKRLAGSSVVGFQFWGFSDITTTHADQVGAERSNLLGIRPRLDHAAGCRVHRGMDQCDGQIWIPETLV